MSDISQYREGRKFAHLTSGTNVLHATGESAWLHSITINTGAVGVIGVFNKGDAEGNGDVAVITVAAGDEGTLTYDVRLNNGLTIDLSVTMDVTVVYE